METDNKTTPQTALYQSSTVLSISEKPHPIISFLRVYDETAAFSWPIKYNSSDIYVPSCGCSLPYRTNAKKTDDEVCLLCQKSFILEASSVRKFISEKSSSHVICPEHNSAYEYVDFEMRVLCRKCKPDPSISIEISKFLDQVKLLNSLCRHLIFFIGKFEKLRLFLKI